MQLSHATFFTVTSLLLATSGSRVPAAPLGTAFTYQGQLTDRGAPANGRYDLTFALFDNHLGGSLVAGPITNSAAAVTNGLFTTTLNFGVGAFTGEARWLEIAVRTNGAAAFATLAPRQSLAPSPYALYAAAAGTAGSASTAVLATGVAAGSIVNASLAANAVTSDKIVDGAIANADISASGIDAGKIIGGDLQAARLSVGYGHMLSGAGATIAGGSGNSASSVGDAVGGGYANHAEGGYSVVSGGEANSASGPGAFVGGGGWDGAAVAGNSAGAPASVIAGGWGNRIQTDSAWAAIGGGVGNTIESYANGAIIAGGYSNRVRTLRLAGALSGTIGGGVFNSIQSNGLSATVSGGISNTANGWYATVPGGYDNLAGADYGFAAGRHAKANHPGAFVWADSTDAHFASSADNQFLIRATGGVGIGTGNPQAALHVAGDAIVGGTNFSASGHTARLVLGDANHAIRSVYAGGLRFGVWPYPDAVAIQDTSGNVGIGTNGPNQKLEVNGRIRMGTWTGDGTTAVYKNASGDIGLQSSDQRRKKNIETIPNALDVVARLRGVTFHWLNQPDNAPKTVGLVAQEVRAAMPELTFEFQGDDGLTYFGVHYEKVAAVLANAVQEQQKGMADLKTRLERLEQIISTQNGGLP